MPTFTKLLNSISKRNEWPVHIDHSYVSVDEAVGILSQSSGNEGRDFLHTILIDLLQRGYVRAIRSAGDDPPLRYVATESGRAYSHSMLGLPDDIRHS